MPALPDFAGCPDIADIAICRFPPITENELLPIGQLWQPFRLKRG
jgi:hypothetical protein